MCRKYGKWPHEALALDIDDLVTSIELSERADEMNLREYKLKTNMSATEMLTVLVKKVLEL